MKRLTCIDCKENTPKMERKNIHENYVLLKTECPRCAITYEIHIKREEE